MEPISKSLDDYNKIESEFCQNFPDFVFSDYIDLDDYLATSEPLPEEIEQKEANLESENEQSDDDEDEVIEEKRPDISKNEIISTLSNFKQYAAQSKFENFTCEMLSLIYKFEKLIYNEPKEMVQNTMDKYLV